VADPAGLSDAGAAAIDGVSSSAPLPRTPPNAAGTTTTDVTPKGDAASPTDRDLSSPRQDRRPTLFQAAMAADAVGAAGEADDVRRIFLATAGAAAVVVILRAVLGGVGRRRRQQ